MNSTTQKTIWGISLPVSFFKITAGTLLVVATGSVCLLNSHKLAAMASYPAMTSQNETATSLITKDIRQAHSLEHASADRVVLKAVVCGKPTVITYSYDRAAGILTRADEHSTQTVLTDLDAFSFTFFQRPAAGASFDAFAPATAANARMISCHWSCSRRMAGAKIDSSSFELAHIVLRNRC